MRTSGRAGLIALLIGVVGLALCLSFWPGIMIWDSGRQYGQALTGQFDDWHPPLMEAAWRVFILLMPKILSGPGPMLVLQLGLYSAALGAMAYRAWQRGHGHEAAWLAATGLFPPTLVLMATIIKDSLMAAALLAAFALLVHFRETGNRLSRGVGVALVLFAACLRFNAFLAGVPLLLMAMPPRWTVTRVRQALAVAAATALLLLAMPVANRMLQAQRSGVELSLVIFDLAGITAHGGGNVFPPLAIKHPVAVNQRCYLAEKWDPYAWWEDNPCPIQFAGIRASFAAHHINPEIFWMRAILAHPLAYTEHRLAHWNIAGDFLTRLTPERWIVSASDPNDWNFQVVPHIVNRAIVSATWDIHAMPFGWPCWWLALSFALVVLARGTTRVLTLSAFLYSLGYGVFSVASELRYYAWPMIASLIATVMFFDQWPQQRHSRVQWTLAAAPLLLVTVLGLGWRWL